MLRKAGLRDSEFTRASPGRDLPAREWERLLDLRVPVRVAATLRGIVPVPFALIDVQGIERGRVGGDARDVCLAGADLPRDMRAGPCAGCTARLAAAACAGGKAAAMRCPAAPSIERRALPILRRGHPAGALVTGALVPGPLPPAEIERAAAALALPGGEAALSARLAGLVTVPPGRAEAAALLLDMAAQEMGLFLGAGATAAGRASEALAGILGASPAMESVLRAVEAAARLERPVLLVGETGTGKDLVANALHAASRRRERDLVIVNCAALPESLLDAELFGHVRGAFSGAVQDRKGFFETASGGTIFLDEVEAMSLPLQAKLLRIVEDGTFYRVGSSEPLKAEVRLIAATNEDLQALVERGAFRRDLYYRLNVLKVEVPPLRARLADIPELVEAFARRACIEAGIPEKAVEPGAVARLMAYSWPGNVRELLHEVERAVLRSPPDRVRAADVEVGPDPRPGEGRDVSFREARRLVVETWERQELKKALLLHGGNKTRLARAIGLTRGKLIAKIRKLGLDADGDERGK